MTAIRNCIMAWESKRTYTNFHIVELAHLAQIFRQELKFKSCSLKLFFVAITMTNKLYFDCFAYSHFKQQPRNLQLNAMDNSQFSKLIVSWRV